LPWQLSGGGPVVVGERLARDGVQPRQRLSWYLVELAPTDEERLGNEILDRIGSYPSTDIERYVVVVAFVDLLEPAVCLPLHSSCLCRDARRCYSRVRWSLGERSSNRR
jgi:hypothetical protein